MEIREVTINGKQYRQIRNTEGRWVTDRGDCGRCGAPIGCCGHLHDGTDY